MRILLYDDGCADALDVAQIAAYLGERARHAQVAERGALFPLDLSDEAASDCAKSIASTKMPGINQKLEAPREPFFGEIEFEKRRLQGKTKAFGVAYDGVFLQGVMRRMLAPEERRLDIVSIVLTNRLFATWDSGDRRYHLRTSVYGTPSIIATTGVVEAPAKPRQYYLLKQQYESLKKDLTPLKDRFAGRFIDYDDARLTEVVKGLAAQAVAYAVTGNPFCDDKGCRLFNAHWQEDLIHAQLGGPSEFCPRHTDMFAGLF